MGTQKIHAKVSGKDSDTAYIALPGHPRYVEGGKVARTISLDEIMESYKGLANYKGPRIYLDFNSEGKIVGIEILV